MNASSDHSSTQISPGLRALIERERLSLMRVSSLLTCLRIATLYDEEVNVADIVEVANGVMSDAIEALDIVNLTRVAVASDRTESD